MDTQLIVNVMALVAVVVLIAIIVTYRRRGPLNTAAWLVIWGAIVLLTEHPLFAIGFSAPILDIANELKTTAMPLIPHARTHFFMAGVCTIIGLIMLCVIARTLLREGRRAGWFSVLFALIVGATSDLLIGAEWFQHGSPLYPNPIGVGWQFLYVYFIAWGAALIMAYQPVFRIQ
ncbi:MAG: hypothetical protein HY870_00780 [Chloroflexi bacterium]|nr:hypothetical protein [Chloroflexota bacterium]